MKCTVCGYENDVFDKFCGHCGEKLSLKAEAFHEEKSETIHCPRCRSKRVYFVSKEQGSDFSASNACCGYIIFGPLGILCGLASDKKTEVTRKCMKCGHEF